MYFMWSALPRRGYLYTYLYCSLCILSLNRSHPRIILIGLYLNRANGELDISFDLLRSEQVTLTVEWVEVPHTGLH